MSYDFSASMSKLTDLYMSSEIVGKKDLKDYTTVEEAKEKFGDAFAKAYDSLTVMRALDSTMRTNYENNHKDDLEERSQGMMFSKGGNKIIDMLDTKLTDDMQEKVNIAMESALDDMIGHAAN